MTTYYSFTELGQIEAQARALRSAWAHDVMRRLVQRFLMRSAFGRTA